MAIGRAGEMENEGSRGWELGAGGKSEVSLRMPKASEFAMRSVKVPNK